MVKKGAIASLVLLLGTLLTLPGIDLNLKKEAVKKSNDYYFMQLELEQNQILGSQILGKNKY